MLRDMVTKDWQSIAHPATMSLTLFGEQLSQTKGDQPGRRWSPPMTYILYDS